MVAKAVENSNCAIRPKGSSAESVCAFAVAYELRRQVRYSAADSPGGLSGRLSQRVCDGVPATARMAKVRDVVCVCLRPVSAQWRSSLRTLALTVLRNTGTWLTYQDQSIRAGSSHRATEARWRALGDEGVRPSSAGGIRGGAGSARSLSSDDLSVVRPADFSIWSEATGARGASAGATGRSPRLRAALCR